MVPCLVVPKCSAAIVRQVILNIFIHLIMAHSSEMHQTFGIPQVLNVSDGESIDLTALWKDRKCIVCFLRHFQCRFCRQQIADLNRIQKYLNDHHHTTNTDSESIESNKIHIIAIGVCASLKEAKSFQTETGFEGELYVDALSSDSAVKGAKSGNSEYETTAPSYDVMRLFDHKHFIFGSDGTSFRPEVAELAQMALNNGFKDGDTTNRPKQLFLRIGGMFVLGPGNHCDFSFRSKWAGDHVPIHRVLRAAIGENLKEDALDKSFVYPSTQKWANDLNVAHRSESGNTEKSDANYLESLRIDQEQRLKSKEFVVNPKSKMFAASVMMGSVFSLYFGSKYSAKIRNHKYKVGTVLSVVGAMVFGAQYFKQLKDSTLLPSAPREVKLLKLTEIDEIASTMGHIECDCSFVETQDVSNKSREIQEVETRLRALSSPKKLKQKSFEDSQCPFGGERGDVKGGDGVGVGTQTEGDHELKALLKTCCYLREFLAKPHPLVGRKGPVCPFVPGSLRMDAMYLSVIHSESINNKMIRKTTTFEEVEDVARSFVDRFHDLEPRSGRKAAYKAVVLIFPDIPPSKAPMIIDRVQLKLKPEFVSKGLMIGEFHEHNNACGLRNENFYPLRTPIPSLAIRCIVPTDLVFLSPTKYAPKLRVEFLKSYLKQFEDDQSRAAQKAVKEAMELLKSAEREV